MSYGLWLSAAGLQVNEYRQSIAANNLANTDTVGFKRDLAVIQERMVETRAAAGQNRFANGILDNMTGGSWVKPTIHTFDQGGLERTDSNLDVAIKGPGFLVVQDGGEARYTRDGRMTLNRDGEIVMVAGEGRLKVLGPDNQPIVVDPRAQGELDISPDGIIRQGENLVGRLSLVNFAGTGQLTKEGTGLYRNHGQPPTNSKSQVLSGYTERSTADPIMGLAAMIEISRAYELNANLISLQDQTIGQAVTTVGRIG